MFILKFEEMLKTTVIMGFFKNCFWQVMMLIAVHVWIVYIIFVNIKSSFGKCIKNFKYWLHDRHEMQYETWQHLIGYMFLVDFNISVIFFFSQVLVLFNFVFILMVLSPRLTAVLKILLIRINNDALSLA